MLRTSIIILAVSSLLCCTPQKQELTKSDKERILTELQPVVKKFTKACEQADFNNAISVFEDTKDFTAIVNGNAIPDFNSFKEGIRKQFESLVSQQYTVASEKFDIISNTSAAYTLIGSDIDQLKNGDRVLVNPLAVTFLFRKSNNEWKIFYMHESATVKIDSLGDK